MHIFDGEFDQSSGSVSLHPLGREAHSCASKVPTYVNTHISIHTHIYIYIYINYVLYFVVSGTKSHLSSKPSSSFPVKDPTITSYKYI